ncbi:peptidoglycan-binding protein [Dermacoccaceae bacterium W4C1]
MALNRRAVLAATVVAGSSTLLPVTPALAATTVNMEALLLAAQWDPMKAGTGLTPGAKTSVLAVENALVKKGLLSKSYADGHFGTATVTAYAAYQRSLGYTGLDANGLPGRTSLTKLGAGRFTVTRPVTLGAKVNWQGAQFRQRTVDMLKEARRISGVAVVVEQGSYAVGQDPTSAGSHDGGGAVDLDAEALTTTQCTALVTAMRRVGFAAWRRTPSQGKWPLHIHGIAVLDTDLAPLARQQVGLYYEGRNGLSNNGRDDGPAVTKTTWEAYRRAH